MSAAFRPKQLLRQPGGFEGLIPINDRIDTNRPSVPELPDMKQAHLAWHATFVSFAHPTDLNEDAVFGKRDSLVVDFEPHPPGKAADGREMKVPYHSARYDFRLAPAP